MRSIAEIDFSLNFIKNLIVRSTNVFNTGNLLKIMQIT